MINRVNHVFICIVRVIVKPRVQVCLCAEGVVKINWINYDIMVYHAELNRG